MFHINFHRHRARERESTVETYHAFTVRQFSFFSLNMFSHNYDFFGKMLDLFGGFSCSSAASSGSVQ